MVPVENSCQTGHKGYSERKRVTPGNRVFSPLTFRKKMKATQMDQEKEVEEVGVILSGGSVRSSLPG